MTECKCGCGATVERTWKNGHHMMARAKPVADRFWPKVEKGPECWLWTGAADEKGYGRIGVRGKRTPAMTHRVSYELAYGDIPEGLFVCHSCDTPACVRPEHLFLGTQKDNMNDMTSKGRGAMQKLSLEQVYEIRDLCEQGWMRSDIARAYGVNPSRITNIMNGKTWSYA